MYYFPEYFGCGSCYVNRETVSYNVYDLYDNYNKIHAFFSEYPVLGHKYRQYSLWIQAMDIVRSGEHVTQEGLEKVLELKKKFKEL